jgi:hypothetical protein
VALSVVGTERLLASGYFRAKMAQENLIKASSISYFLLAALRGGAMRTICCLTKAALPVAHG